MSKRLIPSGCQKRKKKQKQVIENEKLSTSLLSWVATRDKGASGSHAVENGDEIGEPPSYPSELSDINDDFQDTIDISSKTDESDYPTDCGQFGVSANDVLVRNIKFGPCASGSQADENIDEVDKFPRYPIKMSNINDDFQDTIDILSKTDELDLKSNYPTDRGKFDETVTDSLKRSIIKFGPCKPNIEFPRTENRCFSSHYYHAVTKGGLRIPRVWLCYSMLLDVAYCETCWLFAERNNGKFKNEWINGMNDWQHLSQSIQRHESSVQHLDATMVKSLWIKNQTIDVHIEKQYTHEAMLWRNVLKRIIKIILSLTAGNTALRGNEGSLKIKNPNEGNFLRSINLLAEFDPVLNNLLNDENQKIKYLSPLIQNEIIDILSTELRHIICNDIRNSCFFSVIIDSTQDITKEDQISLIIRYTAVNYEKKRD